MSTYNNGVIYQMCLESHAVYSAIAHLGKRGDRHRIPITFGTQSLPFGQEIESAERNRFALKGISRFKLADVCQDKG
jgi:hypothetical protein